MERRYEARLDELLDDAEVRPSLLRGLLPRLETFLEPFVASLCCAEQRTNAPTLSLRSLKSTFVRNSRNHRRFELHRIGKRATELGSETGPFRSHHG
jgi:hypothetical protein